MSVDGVEFMQRVTDDVEGLVSLAYFFPNIFYRGRDGGISM